MNNLILDTTFVLPLFGIRVKLGTDFHMRLKLLWQRGIEGYQLFLPSISLLETMYLLNREYRQKGDGNILTRYQLVLPTVTNSKIVNLYNPLLDPNCIEFANKLRIAGHSDLMDCLIAASAATLNGYLMTRDRELIKVMKLIPDLKIVTTLAWKEISDKLNS